VLTADPPMFTLMDWNGESCISYLSAFDAKVPRHLRDSLPLVFAGGELAWVPGVAIDARLASPTGVWAIHAEVVEASGPRLESVPPSQGVFPE